jgi:hypothetical protein
MPQIGLPDVLFVGYMAAFLYVAYKVGQWLRSPKTR